MEQSEELAETFSPTLSVWGNSDILDRCGWWFVIHGIYAWSTIHTVIKFRTTNDVSHVPKKKAPLSVRAIQAV